MNYYSHTPSQLFETFNTSSEGLPVAEAASRLEASGPNSLPTAPLRAWWQLVFDQVKSPLIYILLIAVAITVLLQEYSDAVVIGLAVFVNTVLGFIQEYKAQQAFHSLRDLVTPQTQVLRGGVEVEIPVAEIVPGDVLILHAGMRVAADIRIVKAVDLMINEAVLTGESLGVQKKVDALEPAGEEAVPLAEQKNMAFMGTSVLTGSGRGVVVATGSDTELGTIAALLHDTEDEQTPLQVRLARLSIQLAGLVAIIAGFIVVLGVASGHSFVDMFTTAVALAVAAIPEGLAVSLTAILAIGMQRILKRKALVRKLVAAETLGSTSVICTDKTGTITEGEMQVTETLFTDREAGLRAFVLNNDHSGATEAALTQYVHKEVSVAKRSDLQETHERIDEVPFSSARKYMLTLHSTPVESEHLLVLKGAPEHVLSWCHFSSESARAEWEARVAELSSRGLRVLAVAEAEGSWRKVPKQFIDRGGEGFTLLGVVGMEDPPREGVAEALEQTRSAGIRTIVITGDNRYTAMAIMSRVGLSVVEENVLDGIDLDKLNDAQLRDVVTGTTLFARVSPAHKLRIVEALQANGEVVAMTGDGVNDAPALKKADIGVVVDSATDVSKETADMVLLDSNFATIVAAVEEGRGIFNNMRKIILYLLSDSFSEIVLIVGAILARIPLPLVASQILYINLVTDGFPNLALTVDPAEEGIMSDPPRKAHESLIDTEIKVLIAVVSFFTAATSLAIFVYYWRLTGDVTFARSVVFAALGVDSLLYVFSTRSLRHSVFTTPLFNNVWLLIAVAGGFILQLVALYTPFLQRVLQLVPIGWSEWAVVGVVSVMVIVLIEMSKALFLRRSLGSRS